MSKLDLENIRIDGGTQSRVELNESVVSDYADAIAAGENMPPVVVFFDGADHWLADGFHRYFGHKKLGFIEILADIREGTRRDAVLYSVGANGNHGLRRSNADKRKAVETLLKDADWVKWSNVQIARAASVSESLVRHLRENEDTKPATRTVERNGKTYEQKTANIGKKPTPAAPAPAPQAASAPAPSPAEEPPQPEDTGPDESELAANRAAEQADREALEKLLEADDKLATAVAEVKRLNHLNAQLQQRINGLMNEKAEAIKLCKSLQRKLDKLQKVEA